jgi:hypothetical protein
MTMETKETNISPFLHSFQLTYGTRKAGTIDGLILRTRDIGKKINSIIESLYALDTYERLPPQIYLDILDMIKIRDAIGVYGIYHPDNVRRTREPNMLWYKEQLASERTLPNKEGAMWLDYFGDDKIITDIGGYVVVSLSHKGISYLNGISEGVYSLSSSYTTTE